MHYRYHIIPMRWYDSLTSSIYTCCYGCYIIICWEVPRFCIHGFLRYGRLTRCWIFAPNSIHFASPGCLPTILTNVCDSAMLIMGYESMLWLLHPLLGAGSTSYTTNVVVEFWRYLLRHGSNRCGLEHQQVQPTQHYIRLWVSTIWFVLSGKKNFQKFKSKKDIC